MPEPRSQQLVPPLRTAGQLFWQSTSAEHVLGHPLGELPELPAPELPPPELLEPELLPEV